MQNGLADAYHLIEITDNAGCTFIDSIYVMQTPDLAVFSSAHATTCIGCPNGYFDVTFSGGKAPYQVSWTGGHGNLVGNKIYNLSGGIYSICVTDKNNCSKCIQDTIIESNIGISEIAIDNFLTVYPNPTSNYTNLLLSNSILNSATVLLFGMEGKMVRSYTISEDPISIYTGDLNPGIYFLRLQTELGEMISGTKKLVVLR